LFFSSKKDKTHNEQALLARFRQNGDLGVLGEIYSPYMNLVFGICLGYLKDRNKAEDAVMQIFEKLIVDLRKHEVVNFKSWIHSVARNYCLMELRKLKKEFTAENDVFSIPIMDFDEEMHLESELQALEKCTEALKREQKEVIELFYKQEKSYADIVVVLKIELKQVKSLLQNARRMLKICIEKSV
jgi:RNA polymerase sigma factor (sigma-70 family)